MESAELTLYDLYSLCCYSFLLLLPLLWCKVISKHNHKVWAQIHLLPHPPGPIECLILAGVVSKWKGGQRPQRAPSLDPCQPHTSALIWAPFEPEGRVAATKRLIPIDLHWALRCHSSFIWLWAAPELSEDIMLLSEPVWLGQKIWDCVCF